MTGAPVVVDLRAVQSPDHRGRGIERWSYESALALERVRPDLVGAYLLDPEWPPPGAVDELLATGKLVYLGTAEADAALAAARVFHCSSPFELGRTIQHVRPPFVDHLGLRYSTVLYDLIPLRHAGWYLAHLAQRRRYTARLAVLRAADRVLAISAAAAADAAELGGVVPARCHVVGTGVSDRFVPPTSPAAAGADVTAFLPAVDRPFVLYPGGHDARKNVEGLIAAFAELSGSLGEARLLVVVGDLPALAANHYRHLAAQAGIADRLVLTGFVSDEQLVSLYQATDLLVFPSVAEGFGLPVAEALACGAVACVSDRPPLDELVLDAAARFDPHDSSAMAAAMGRCVTDEVLRASVRTAAPGVLRRWDEVAGAMAAVLEDLARAPRRPWTRRHKTAVVSPFPPLRTGVAGYSKSLVEAMHAVSARQAAQGAPALEIDCFADGRDRYPEAPEPVAGAVPLDARNFTRVDGIVGGYDRVLYVLGNSECHTGALVALRRRPGVVYTHDVRLSGLMTFSTDTYGGVPGGLAATIARTYPGLPDRLGEHRWVPPADQERYGLLLLRDVLAHSDRLLVSSESARRLAALDAGPPLDGRIGVLPFAADCLSADERAAVAAARAQRGHAGRLRIASFGILNPQKRPATLVGAVDVLARRGHDVELALVGPASAEQTTELEQLTAVRELADRVRVVGEVTRERYLAHLGSTDVAVQLRHRSFGEASAALSECLSAGVATVVSDVGWMAELPDEAVVKVSREATAEELADALDPLVATASRRDTLGAAGRRWAAGQTFEVAARALLDAVDR